jgi:hypothetical protein
MAHFLESLSPEKNEFEILVYILDTAVFILP